MNIHGHHASSFNVNSIKISHESWKVRCRPIERGLVKVFFTTDFAQLAVSPGRAAPVCGSVLLSKRRDRKVWLTHAGRLAYFTGMERDRDRERVGVLCNVLTDSICALVLSGRCTLTSSLARARGPRTRCS